MARIILLLELAKELAKVTWFIGLAVLAFQLAWIIGSEHVTIHHTLQSLESTARHTDDASARISDLIGPVESRASEPQTLAHVVSSTAEMEESFSATVKDITTVTSASRLLVVDMDAAIQHINTVTVPGIESSATFATNTFTTAIQHADATIVSAQPVLIASKDLIVDAQASLDDSYWDVKAMIESATVTSASIGQNSAGTATAIRELSGHIAGISADAHMVSDKFVRPKPWPSKLWDVIRLLGSIGGRFVP